MEPKLFKKKIKNFIPCEFAEPINYGEPRLFYNLDSFRNVIGCRIFPSPSPGALARFKWSDRHSQHYSDRREIRSCAADVFCECSPIHAYTQALACQLWGGIGVYFDTEYNGQPWCLFHLDIRAKGFRHAKNTALVWFRDPSARYHYPQYNRRMEATFLQLLIERGSQNGEKEAPRSAFT